MRLMFCVTWLFLSLLPLAALAADATSYDPTRVMVKAQSAGGVPVGTIVAWPVATNPEDWDKWLECNGQSITRAAYPALYAIVGAKVCQIYATNFLKATQRQAGMWKRGCRTSGGLAGTSRPSASTSAGMRAAPSG